MFGSMGLGCSAKGGGLGDELLSNGTFDIDTDGWTPGRSTILSVSGQLEITQAGNPAGWARNDTILSLPSSNYVFSFDRINDLGDARVLVQGADGTTIILDTTTSGTGIKTYEFTGDVGYVYVYSGTDLNDEKSYLDNISLKEIL